MLTREELPECPVAVTVQLIGSKWKLLILRNLLERPWRFNELKKKPCRNKPESIDRQPPFHGGRRSDNKNGIPRSSPPCGIFLK